MEFNDIKLYTINSSTLVVTFTDIEMWLKIILLIATIVYTLLKIKKIKDEKKQ